MNASAPRIAPTPHIDAHLHLWDLDLGEYSWLRPEHGELFASFRPERAETELGRAGIDGAILVQAEDTLRDTQYLLDVADQADWVAGVVGWVQLDDPSAAAEQLDRWRQHPAFCGVRHLVHDDPRADFLELPSVRASLAELADRGVPFDVPDAWPRHLAQVTALAGAIPELRIVVDHLAKPPRGRGDFGAWRAELARVAEHPNTVAKVSGLRMSGQPYSVEALRPVWDVAIELFGPNRLMVGSDWPVSGAGDYVETWTSLEELAGTLSDEERRAVLGGTSVRVYGLAERAH